MDYHISSFNANDVWPHGGWSLYQINGDQIADRVVRERINPKGYYEGKVIARHSWCGFMGCFTTLDDIMAAIQDHENKHAKKVA
jgi:hypothetical protein